jgi:hypothetical protein
MRVDHAVAIAGVCLLAAMLPAEAAPAEATANFRLQAAISERIFGPFTYTDGARIRLETGDYRLRVLGGTRFRLVDPARERSFGDYELVLGRMIDVDETLFTIAEITDGGQPRGSSRVAAAPYDPGRIPVTIGAGYEQTATSYRWTVNGADGGSPHDIERTRWGVWVARNWWRLSGGISSDVTWDHTVKSDGSSFDNATMNEGSGWWVNADVAYPFFQSGHWRADARGAFSYSSEEMTLTYSQVTTREASREEPVEGSSNDTVTVSYTEFIAESRSSDATLSEWLLQAGVALTYEAEQWMLYGGVDVDLATEAELSATIKTSSTLYKLEVEREHPIALWGGGKLKLGKATRLMLEGRAGSSTGIRLGVEREF